MTSARPRYPGARWWKFDFHTHTPASSDTTAWALATGTPDEITPEKWLLKCMTAGLDCVAVTDHNCGLWIDRLKGAFTTMKAAADRGAGLPGFRDLTLFPGVEISVQGGVHVLAILPPEATTSDVDTLLGSVGYKGTKGDSDGVTTKGLAEVLAVIRGAGGLPVPAHADRPKGLLECVEGSRRSRVDANTLRQALEVEGLLAVEWCGGPTELPDCAVPQASRLARVLGSDTHSFQQKNALGSAFTWVKMASPTLEGLRLALLDGNGVSIRRSDEGPFDPDRLPAHTIQAIEIDKARFMGNRKPERLVLSPFFNAVVGGRGTGKSTVVHALRLACGRGAELLDGSEPRTQFEAFRKVPKGRTGEGGLREETVLAVEWRRDDALFRVSWTGSASQAVVEEWRGDGWKPTQSQAVNASRFPLRIFSQGQVATIAGAGRRALVSIIDESAGVEPLRAATDEATRVFLEQRARLRTLDGRLAELPEVERKLGEAARKLEAFSQADHAAVLREYARTQGQVREVKSAFEQARAAASRIEAVAEEVALDDWSAPSLTEADGDLLAWRTAADQRLQELRERLRAEATALRADVAGWNDHERFKAWRAQQQAAKQAHDTLQAKLASQGVPDTGAFERLTREHQALEQKRKELVRLGGDRVALVRDIEGQRAVMATRRAAITAARQEFVARVLHNNEHVRITVVPHGFDPRQIEREVRGLLDANDDRFAIDILSDEDGEERGLARGGMGSVRRS